MLTLISVFSFVVVGDWFCEGFITVVLLSFFCVGGFTTVVLLSFFSAGGFVTVVSFCSQAARSARPISRQIYFLIQKNRVSERILSPSIGFLISLSVGFIDALRAVSLLSQIAPAKARIIRIKRIKPSPPLG